MRSLLVALAMLAGCAGDDVDTSDTSDTSHETTDGVSCDDDNVCTVSGVITENLTMTADKMWLLRGGVFIGDDINETVLTIEPGTTVYGESATDGMLVIRRGSRIEADGTADAPIVFTSSKEPGTRSRGDWGGLIINGRATVNSCIEEEVETCEAYGEGGTGWYGGDDDADSSGTLRYVRVEFAGTLISPDNELNGIAFQGVGSGTTVDYVQVHMNADDGVEFFGGAVNAKHILVTALGDDGIDWTDGWRGKLQFGIVQQGSDAGDNGLEADNNAEANDAAPMSEPWLSNVTVIGSPDSESSDLGMLLREGTGVHLANVLVTGFNEACLDVDHDATFANVDSGALELTNVILDCATNFIEDEGEPSVEEGFLAGEGNAEAAIDLVSAFDPIAPDYQLEEGSDLLTGGAVPDDAFFESVEFLGAVGAEDWTATWTTHASN